MNFIPIAKQEKLYLKRRPHNFKVEFLSTTLRQKFIAMVLNRLLSLVKFQVAINDGRLTETMWPGNLAAKISGLVRQAPLLLAGLQATKSGILFSISISAYSRAGRIEFPRTVHKGKILAMRYCKLLQCKELHERLDCKSIEIK